MENKKIVPKATLQRYPVYLKALRKLQAQGVERVMSRELANFVSIDPTTFSGLMSKAHTISPTT